MNQSANLDPQMQEAVELHRLQRLRDAEMAYRAIIQRQPRNADAHHLLGVLLQQAGHPEQAIPYIERAIAILPGSAQFHSSLGRAHYALSHSEQALAPLRRATELEPRAAATWCDLGAVLQARGEIDEAEKYFRRALVLEPGHVMSRYNLAILLKQRGDIAGAVELMQELLRETPDAPMINTLLAGYLLEAGDVEAALGHCRRAFELNPRDLLAMSFQSIALLRAGDREGARRLVDLDRLVAVRAIEAPPGYGGLDGFNAALERQVLAHPTLEYERRQNATRNGRHTDNLLRERGDGPVQDLRAVLDTAVRAYLDGLPRDGSHPYLAFRPRDWRLQAWAVVMDSGGHQLAHTHPDGWVSGVYYVRVPSAVSEDDPSRAGWIEFGRPLPALLAGAEPDLRLLRPEPGTLVLFPSFFYHRTVPFQSGQHRISIAFDAQPTVGEGHVPPRLDAPAAPAATG